MHCIPTEKTKYVNITIIMLLFLFIYISFHFLMSSKCIITKNGTSGFMDQCQILALPPSLLNSQNNCIRKPCE